MKDTAVTINNLTYTYPDNRTGLCDVSLTIEQGARVALVGKNGSGKTTLLLHLAGLLTGQGTIIIHNVPLTKNNVRTVRQKTGFLFNQPEYQFIMPDLLNDVMLNIKTGDVEKKKEEACYWLEQFRLLDKLHYSPLQLSAGEMKRAALAGIFAKRPEMVLMDEPLNNIDKVNSLSLLAMLRSMPQTMVIATHRTLLLEQLATHMAVMEEGRLVDVMPVSSDRCKPYMNKLLF